jgi:hypothetical protein
LSAVSSEVESRRERSARQRLIGEIGDAGQAKIDATAVVVSSSGPSAHVEASYLAGAGFGMLRVSGFAVSRAAKRIAPEITISADAPPMVPPSTQIERVLAQAGADPSAVAVAAGAARALAAIRRTIGLEKA